MGESNRSEKFAEALGHVRRGSPHHVAMEAVGLDPSSVTTEELEQFEAAEAQVVEEMLAVIKKAAKTDPKAAKWLKDRGIDV